MNYFEDYYSPEEPEKKPNAYIPQEEPKPPKMRKERKGLKRLVCALVAVALVAGSCSATAVILNNRWSKQMDRMLKRMDDKIAALEKEAQTVPTEPQSTIIRPATTVGMTPGEVYAQNVDAVVAIKADVTKRDGYGRTVSGYSAGTGFIITPNGYVVTNYHVVEGATKVVINTHNDEAYEAEVIGYEEDNDVALLKVAKENLPHVTLGRSSDLRVGDQVVAIGNVLSTFNSSLTVGYVSGIDRVLDADDVAINMIQSDVAINSGNSGGPLFNMNGEVIGITTAKFSGRSSSGASIEGLSFAIPIDDVAGMIQNLQNNGYVSSAYMGVMIQDVTANAQYYGLPAGAYVESLIAGGAAEHAGILPQDIITEISGHKVTSVSDLNRVLRKFTAGDTISVQVYRAGQYKVLELTLGEKPREDVQTSNKEQIQQPSQTIPGLPEDGSFEDFYNFFRDYFG